MKKFIPILLILFVLGGLFLAFSKKKSSTATSPNNTAATNVKSRSKSTAIDKTLRFEKWEVFSIEDTILHEETRRFIHAKGNELYKSEEMLKELAQEDLSTDDFKALFNFLVDKEAEQNLALASHKNDLLTHLIEERELHPKLADVLLTILTDRSQPSYIREYIVQFIPRFYKRRWSEGSDTFYNESFQREVMEEALNNLSFETEGAVAGTALIRLYELSLDYEHLKKENFIERAEDLVNDSSYSVASQMGALTILAKSDSEIHLKKLKEIAQDDNASPALRMSSIHLYNEYSQEDPEFKQYLSSVYDDPNVDERVHRAIRTVLYPYRKDL